MTRVVDQDAIPSISLRTRVCYRLEDGSDLLGFRDATLEELDNMYSTSDTHLRILSKDVKALVDAYGGPDQWDRFKALREALEKFGRGLDD